MNYHLETLKAIMSAIDFAANNGTPDDLTDRQFEFVQKRLDKESYKLSKRIKKIESNEKNKFNRRSKQIA